MYWSGTRLCLRNAASRSCQAGLGSFTFRADGCRQTLTHFKLIHKHSFWFHVESYCKNWRGVMSICQVQTIAILKTCGQRHWKINFLQLEIMFVLHKFLIFRYSVGDKYSKIIKCIELNRTLYQLSFFFFFPVPLLLLIIGHKQKIPIWSLIWIWIFLGRLFTCPIKCDLYLISCLNISDGMLKLAARLGYQSYEVKCFEQVLWELLQVT